MWEELLKEILLISIINIKHDLLGVLEQYWFSSLLLND